MDFGDYIFHKLIKKKYIFYYLFLLLYLSLKKIILNFVII